MSTRSPDLLAGLKGEMRRCVDHHAQNDLYLQATSDGVQALRMTLRSNSDEASLQATLERHPILLVNELAGAIAKVPLERGAVFKQVEILDRHVADFAFVTADSVGASWYFIEIESARDAFLNNGDHSARLRKGLQQVLDWQQTIAQDRRTIESRLHDLRSRHTSHSRAPWLRSPYFLLIIGRSDTESEANRERRASLENAHPNVSIASWDRLLRQFSTGDLEAINHEEFRSLGTATAEEDE